MHILFFTVLILYLAVTIAPCVLHKKRNSSNFSDYLTASNSTGLIVMAGSAAASHVGSGFVIGGAESGALYGISGAWYGLGCAFATILVSFTVIRFARRNHYITLSDYFKLRYQDNRTVFIYSIATPVSYIAAMSAQMLAGKAIFEAFGVNGSYGIWITAGVVLLYSLLFGLRGTYLASTIHVCVIAIGLLSLCGMLFFSGKLNNAWKMLPPSYRSFTALGPSDTVMYVLPTLLASLVGQVSFQRANSARSERDATWGHILAGIILIPLALAPVIVGVYGAAYAPETLASAQFFQVALSAMPPILSALLVAALACVIMATCSSGFLGISATIVHDIYQGVLRPAATDEDCARLSKKISVIACLISVTLAMVFQNIVRILSISYTLIFACCLVPFVGGILWKKGNGTGALVSAIAGGGATILFSSGIFAIPFGSILPLIPSALGFWLGSLAGARKRIVCANGKPNKF